MTRRTTLDFDDIVVGDRLPPMIIDVTATVIVAGALATRDFMPVHHDRDYANAQGSPDIFMNILSDTAYCSRFLTDWAGPDAMVRKLAIRLGAPMFPGSTLTYTGEVTAKTTIEGSDRVDVDLRATNDLGEHVSGTATISFPRRVGLTEQD
jgi:acyl dehydratase